jgi:Uma2 family endonuclease
MSVTCYTQPVCVPSNACTLAGFRAWAKSDEFPKGGRISFLDDRICIDMDPEELISHNGIRAGMLRTIMDLNDKRDLGEFFGRGILLTNLAANFSTEPDSMLVKWESFESKRVRLVPCLNVPNDFDELEGTPDWVFEVVSDNSEQIDTQLLRELYHRADVSEYWIIDARGEEIDFQILVRRRTRYVAVSPKDGWYYSPVFGRSFRLERWVNRAGRWQYKLHVKED